MSDLVAAPLFAAAAVLLVAGIVKLRAPDSLARVLTAIHIPFPITAARAIGLCEVAVAAAVLAVPSPPAAFALGAMYGSFAGFLVYLMVADVPVSSCGCLGHTDTPVSATHVALNCLAALTGLVAVSATPANVIALSAELGIFTIPFAAGTAALGYVVYLAVVYLPVVFFAYRRSELRALAR